TPSHGLRTERTTIPTSTSDTPAAASATRATTPEGSPSETSAPPPSSTPSSAGPEPSIVAGLLAALVLAVGARFLHDALPAAVGRVAGEAVVAVLLGLAAANLVPLPAALGPGIRFSYGTVLRSAIVLLGAGLSFREVVAIGGKALGMIAILMTLALA